MDRLVGIARFTFEGGDVRRFKELSRRCMEIVREHDTGTLRYDIFLNEQETEAIVIEEYVDEQALAEHSSNLGPELSRAILSTGTVHGELLGELSDDVRRALAGGPVQPFAPFLTHDRSPRG
jgi:quinol monooxygenase YgiN